MAAPHFTKTDFDEKVLKADKPAVIDFYAQWCGPCQMAAPIIDKLADELGNKVVIGKVDVDEAQELAMQYGVMSIPTMIVFKDGKEVDRKVGFPGEAGLRAMIEDLAK
ncbi:thioredoxin [Candidatus Beckwithbacteria bacterium]|nr:thioredoxin [Candidatus Beckwithbacteria bacterium]